MNNELKESSFRELVLWLLRRRRRFGVTNNSMIPLLKPGDEILVNPHASPRAGDIVIAWHPFEKDMRIVKRVETILDDGSYILKGDNRQTSSDSRTFGPVPAEKIIGRVTSRFG